MYKIHTHTQTKQALQAEKVTTDREVLLADTRIDDKLKELLEKSRTEAEECGLTADVADKRDENSTRIKKDVVKRIAICISEAMGGPILYDQYINFGFSTDVQRCKELFK